MTSASRRINGERLVVLGWGRAILMQLAHPLVAQGVADHSGFRGGTMARVRRLHGTIQAMLALTFGDEQESAEAAAGINAIHDRVHGTLKEGAGLFAVGTPYSATDPDLLTWVQATLLDSLPLAYDRLVNPLTEQDRDAFCAEASAASWMLRIPAGRVPAWHGALDEYLTRTLSSGAIAVTSAARDLARDVLAPPGGFLLRPFASVPPLLTIGWLPPDLRAAYGFSWDAEQQRRLDAWCDRLRTLRRVMPDRLARW